MRRRGKNSISGRQTLAALVVIGLAVFGIGLGNPFQGDDNQQIIESLPVHSLANFGTLLSSSTFYNGQRLTGSYYRPLMTVTYALIYSLFGPRPLAFHLVQLALYVLAAWFFFLLLSRFVRPVMAFLAAVVFLVHPLNSQVAFAIPSMQDTLLGCFGFLSLWLVINLPDKRGRWLAAGALLLAMLSKETGVIFVLLAGLYLGLFERGRLKAYAAVLVGPLAVYAALRVNALGVGLAGSNIAPIDRLSLGQRLLTVPSIILFYLVKLVAPWNLATRYYWTYPTLSLRHVLLPLIIDAAILGLIIWAIRTVWKRRPAGRRTLIWFGTLTVLGILPYLQLVPLDMTACANWFYLPLAGLLGMLAVGLTGWRPPAPALKPILTLGGAAVLALVALTVIQGSFYQTPLKLARHDLAISPQDYAAMGEIAKGLIDQGSYQEASDYARRSAQLQPTMFGYQNLGVALQKSGDFIGAERAYEQALRYGSQATLYENLGLLALETDSGPAAAVKTFRNGLAAYPQDFRLWVFYALYEDAHGRNDTAQSAITNAGQYGQVPQQLSDAIMNNQPFTLPLPGTDRSVEVR